MMIGGKQKEEAVNTGLHNTLATGTFVKGNLTVEGDLRMDGRIEGDIVCSGNTQCANAEIHGQIEGNVNVKEKLVLKSSSIVKGDISLQTLEVEPGAKIEGRISSNN